MGSTLRLMTPADVEIAASIAFAANARPCPAPAIRRYIELDRRVGSSPWTVANPPASAVSPSSGITAWSG